MSCRNSSEARASRALLAGGLSGLAAAVVALICCATPVLAMVLGVLGVGAATAAIGTVIDSVAVPVALASLVLIGIGVFRKRRASDTAT